MNISQLCDLAQQLPMVTSDFPFDETTLVYRVMNKMFALVDIDSLPTTVNLKCDPELAVRLREQYDAVTPAYHQNKTHWNTITLDGSVPDAVLTEMLNHSYQVVKAKLRAADRALLSKGSSE